MAPITLLGFILGILDRNENNSGSKSGDAVGGKLAYMQCGLCGSILKKGSSSVFFFLPAGVIRLLPQIISAPHFAHRIFGRDSNNIIDS